MDSDIEVGAYQKGDYFYDIPAGIVAMNKLRGEAIGANEPMYNCAMPDDDLNGFYVPVRFFPDPHPFPVVPYSDVVAMLSEGVNY